ncbi:MAG: signal peptidase II [Sphaerochaetaceae bacterium]
MKSKAVERYLPFVLTVAIVVLDQVVKAIVVAKIPLGQVASSYFNDFLQFVHVRNKAIGFGLGSHFTPTIKKILFILFPIVLLSFFTALTIKLDDLTFAQRWMLAGIIGGGVGNLIDRIFRPLGVVDFISVKIYGLFGWQRWPTFNIADASVVVAGILLLFNILLVHGVKEATSGQKD